MVNGNSDNISFVIVEKFSNYTKMVQGKGNFSKTEACHQHIDGDGPQGLDGID